MSDVEKKNAKLQKLEKKNVWLNEKEKLIVSLVEIMVIEATVGTKQRTYKTKRKAKCRKSKQRQKLSNSNTQGNRAHQTPPSSPAAQRINMDKVKKRRRGNSILANRGYNSWEFSWTNFIYVEMIYI